MPKSIRLPWKSDNNRKVSTNRNTHVRIQENIMMEMWKLSLKQ